MGIDVMAPEREIKFRPALPNVLLSLDSANPHDGLMSQKTIMSVRKNAKISSNNVNLSRGVSPSLKLSHNLATRDESFSKKNVNISKTSLNFTREVSPSF